MFGGSCLEIESLSSTSKGHIAYTSIFKIELEAAIESEEIELVLDKELYSPLRAFDGLKEELENYESGFHTKTPEELITSWSHSMIYQLEKDWVKYKKSLGSRSWELMT